MRWFKRAVAIAVLSMTTALAGIGEAQIIGKPFIDDELAQKVRLAVAEGDSNKVVRLRR